METETVTQVIERTLASVSPNTLPSQQSSERNPTTTSQVAVTLQSRYGSRQQFLDTFHIDKQMKYTVNADRCYFGTAPTMGMVNEAYGNKTAQEWLTAQLADLSEFSGARDKITARQIKQLADIIADDYHWLKVTEIMLFFRKFKRGEYGKFYGAVDPLTITTALREFLRDRNTAYFKHEQEEREAREAEDRRKWLEWKQRTALEAKDDQKGQKEKEQNE